MRNRAISGWKLVITVVLFPSVIFAYTAPDEVNKADILRHAYHIQVPFTKNIGQVKSKDVSFYTKTFAGTILVEKSGALTYNLPVKDKKAIVIKEIFTEKEFRITGLEPSSTRVNYFTGKEKRNWKRNIPTYESISLGKIYKGVDLTLRAYGNNVEKLFTVLPEENPEIMRIKIRGAKELRVNEKGELEVITELGPVMFTRPLAFQKIGGEKKPVEVAYVLYKGNTYGFEIGSYDKKRPLTIDPLLASTFIGGGNWDYDKSIAIDGSGNVYVTGYTGSSDYPTTSGAYSRDYDVFVSKLDSSLSSLLASTLIGGDGRDWGYSIAIDGSGNVYVTGYTDSKNYPTTPGASDVSHDGPSDAFVSKLDSNLSSLLASTFAGGDSEDWGYSIAIDGSDVYVTGETSSSDYPTTPGAYDESHNGGYDVFVSRLDSNLSSLPASTFIGGTYGDHGNSIAIDGSGDVYVTGKTSSSDYPANPGTYDESHNGNYDVFVSRLDSSLASILASTFIGGTYGDHGNSIAIDGSGDVYVTGETSSSDYPITKCAYDESYNGAYDVFVSKLDSNLTLSASTFIGGDDYDYANSIVIDGSNVYVTGKTSSSDYPTTPDAYDESHNGDYDVFVSKLDSSLNYLLAGTFIGAGDEDQGNSISIDGGDVYVTGETYSSDYPTTPGAYDEDHNGGYDVFVSRLDSMIHAPVNLPVAEAGSDETVNEGITITLDGSGSYDCYDDISYEWEQTSGPDVTLSDVAAVQTTFVAPEIDQDQVTLTFQLTVTDNGGATDAATVSITVMNGVEPESTPPSDSGGDGCFIATAAYGSPMASHVSD